MLELVAVVVSCISAVIAGVALWRNWRWQPREARFEVFANDGAKPGHGKVYFHVLNLGDVTARGVRYQLEGCHLVNNVEPKFEAEIVPGGSGITLRCEVAEGGWEAAFLVVSWNPFPIHRGKRKRQRLSLGEAVSSSRRPSDVRTAIVM